MSRSTRFPACVGAFAAEMDAILRTLRRQGVGATDAEDLAQEVFLVMWRRFSAYDPARPLRPWVLGIALKVAQDHRKRPRREVPTDQIEAADPCPGPDQALAARRARSLVRSALTALPEKQRTVIVLHDLEGLAMVDIAGALSEPITTLYSRLVTARKSFARAVRRMVPPASSPGAWLALERGPDPAPPEVRARLLRRARAIAFLGGAPTDQPPSAGPPPAPRGRFLVGAGGGLAALAGALVVLSSSRPEARARTDLAAVDTGASRRPPPVAAADPGLPRAARVLPPPRLGTTPSAPGLARGLIGYWRFDEATGSPVARDLSGHGTDCLLRGLDPDHAWVGGRLAGAVNLPGRGWLECPRPRFGTRPELTVAAWVKRTGVQRGLRVLATRQLGSGPRDHFFFGFDGERLSLASHIWNGTLRRPLPGIATWPVHRWVHVAAVHRDGRVELWVDGARVAERKSYPGRAVAASSPLLIGAGVNGTDPTDTSQHLLAAVDELLVYDRPLSAAEIGALAEGAQPPASP
jgi:RNA polymerase sigma-70 factor, ECF subfamily